MILGNKLDLEEDRRIYTETAKQASEEFGTLFAEVSAKTGLGIDMVRKSYCLLCGHSLHLQPK